MATRCRWWSPAPTSGRRGSRKGAPSGSPLRLGRPWCRGWRRPSDHRGLGQKVTDACGERYRAPVTIATTADELWAAVETFDAEAAEIAIARLLWDVPLSGAVTGVVLPFLQEVGDRWEAGTISVAHEHFVSDMLRRKLSALSSVPPQRVLEDATAPSPVVLLACPPGERHDLVLLCVALMLRERGVRPRFLGADTPVPAILTAARAAGADAV